MAMKSQKNARKRTKAGLHTKCVARSSSYLPQFAAVSPPEGVGQFVRPMRCKSLKTIRFPAFLRLLSEQTATTHFHLVYESVA